MEAPRKISIKVRNDEALSFMTELLESLGYKVLVMTNTGETGKYWPYTIDAEHRLEKLK